MDTVAVFRVDHPFILDPVTEKSVPVYVGPAVKPNSKWRSCETGPVIRQTFQPNNTLSEEFGSRIDSLYFENQLVTWIGHKAFETIAAVSRRSFRVRHLSGAGLCITSIKSLA